MLWICGAERRFLPSEGELSSGCTRKGGIIKKFMCWPLLQGLESGNAGQGAAGEFEKGRGWIRLPVLSDWLPVIKRKGGK